MRFQNITVLVLHFWDHNYFTYDGQFPKFTVKSFSILGRFYKHKLCNLAKNTFIHVCFWFLLEVEITLLTDSARGYCGGNPALCGSHPLVTPYYCRLGDLLCFVFICVFIVIFSVNCVFSVFSQYFDTIDWVFWPVNTVAHITYTVLVETLNHAQSIN